MRLTLWTPNPLFIQGVILLLTQFSICSFVGLAVALNISYILSTLATCGFGVRTSLEATIG